MRSNRGIGATSSLTIGADPERRNRGGHVDPDLRLASLDVQPFSPSKYVSKQVM
jgi:hypothetical protein